MRAKPFGRLTPSQESVYRFVSKSSRWLTIYEISMLTGVSKGCAGAAIRELLKGDFVVMRKRIYGFDNGEREFKSCKQAAGMCDTSRARHRPDSITGFEPLAKRLRRILGAAKSKQFAEFIE